MFEETFTNWRLALQRLLASLVGKADAEDQILLLGRIAANQVSQMNDVVDLQSTEFKVFSQFGDDGIIHYLTERLPISSKIFIEFGVGDYRESNTRFLLMHKNWSGLVMEGSSRDVARLLRWPQLWKFDLTVRNVFVNRDNIDELISAYGFPREIGLLHVDVDGNDYWIWDRIRSIEPTIVIMEYNSVFGADRPISVPYDAGFNRAKAHPSHLFWGASLPALCWLAEQKRYAFVGCNRAGNNAYFVRQDRIGNGIHQVSVADGYVQSKLRDSRDERGKLNLLNGYQRLAALRGMPVINVETMAQELL